MPTIHVIYGPGGHTFNDFEVEEQLEHLIEVYKAGYNIEFTTCTALIIDALIVPIIAGRINPEDITVTAGEQTARMNRYGVFIVDCEPTQLAPWGWTHLDALYKMPSSSYYGELRLDYSMKLRKKERAHA